MKTRITNPIYISLVVSLLTIIFSSYDIYSQQNEPLPIRWKDRLKNIAVTGEDKKSQQNPMMAITINVPGNYPTIQAAINAANNGDIINVSSGTYRENIVLNKNLQVRGANYGINPNTGSRGAETVIQPATSDPDPYSLTAVTFFYIGSGGSGAVIDGITFDGDNPTLNSAVNINGANIDAAEAIAAYNGLANTVVSNNIIKNVNYVGIDFDNYYNGYLSTYDNIITNNKFDNILPTIFGIGIVLYDNCYATISNNVMTRVRIGVQTGNFFNSDLGSNHSINNNEIESYRLGIWHNLAYSNSSVFDITDNIITTVAGAPNNIGIEISSIQNSVGVNLTDNNVTGARNGINFWNCPTSNTVTVAGGVLTNCRVGVFANNYDGYDSDADPGVYAMTGVTTTSCDTSVWVRDNNLNTNNSTVSLNINNTTNNITGSGIGLLIEGGDASVSFNGAAPVNFSTSLSKYIRLVTNGTNVPAGNINAQNVQFGGVNGSGLSNTDLFAVEDKIDHKTDWNSTGFVSVKSYNKYVTTNSFYPPNTAAASIQNGINIAAAGDTVNAGTGTFNESLNINNSVTLAGSGPSLTIITPAVIVCPTAVNGITITSSNVNVNDLTVSNYNYGIVTSSSTISLHNVESINNCRYALNTSNGTNGLTMIKCKFNNNSEGGWRAGTGDNVSNVMMDSCEAKGNSSASFGFGTFIAASTTLANTFNNITIKNSDFSNNLKKGLYIEKLSNALIDNVTINNSGTDAAYGFNNGIDINLKNGAYTNITLQNSSITNCGFTGTAVNINNPSAVTVKARDDAPSYNTNPATLTGFTMKNCFVTGPVNGLRFGEFDKTNNSPTGNTVTDNSFGNGYSNKAILNKTSNIIAVSCNWYGTSTPSSVVALHGSNLTFLPYLVNGIDNDLIAAGFQPVPGSCTGAGPVVNLTQSTNYVAIQPAIDAANPNDVIEVSPGTYSERVTITKSLTLQGTDKINCIIDGSGFATPGKGIQINSGITDITIKRFTVQYFKGTGGNADAGIYAIGGNNNLYIESVRIQNDSGGSGFYANGPVNTVTLDSVTASGHPNVAGATRGIVIWNGLKENITITNCEVFNNNCCGIELQDGQASGVTVMNNFVHDNGDNGIGLVGLQGPGENLIKGNTLLNNGRFGIEIKNPNGSGLTTGAGRIVVENNDVSRTAAIGGELRDICGIAAFRRGVLAGNVEIPTGVVIQNNIVSGFVQPSASDGFGIVVEGMNHTVSTNTVSGCDVGIQRQAGHTPVPPSDGDQNNLADTYFGRGNSAQTCGVILTGNILTNTINTRDVGGAGAGLVTNLNTTETFCSIQAAIDDAQTMNGDIIQVNPGTYNERVVVSKSLTIQGTDKINCIIDGSGFATPGKGIQINSGITNVTIKRFTVQYFKGTGGNADAGIYAIGGNNNLYIESVRIQNDSGGSGFYANGPVNTVTLDSVTASGHPNVAGATRGIVIWNGLKQNITITNCEVYQNNCCGIELQDGQASGVTVMNNNIHDNGDNGIGLVGLQGPGENLIKGNTLLNNGRFGIEIKNPNGSGLTTGAGRIVVENNDVSRTAAIGGELRDICGIAAFRRGVLAGNVEIPTGVVIQNNIVSGFVQPSASDGFGIVVEGMNHTVSTNTVSGCDVGIQRQAGHTPVPPSDGDQNNLADTYFGRGNSAQTCGVTVTGNILTNTINTRDVGAGSGIVKNFNTNKLFCKIQDAINDAQTLNGHILEVSEGTYNEQVLVNKGVVIKGTGAVKSIIDFTGTVTGKPTVFDVSVPNVTLENMRIRVDQTKLNSAVIASGTDVDNLVIKDDSVEAYGSSGAGIFGPYGNWNAISINYNGSTNYRIAAGGVDNVTVQGTTVSGVPNDGYGQPRYFRSAISMDEGGGLFTGNTLQSINHDVLVRFGSNGNVNVTNNSINGGGVELSDMNAAAGTLTVSGNTFNGAFANVSAAGSAVLRIKNNYYSKPTFVTGNTFTNHQWGISIENYNTITVDNNTFTPLANSTVFHHIAVNTKSVSTNSNLITQVVSDAVITNNVFNYSGTAGGTGLSFHNHDNDAASIGTYTVGTAGNENSFNSGIANFIYLDPQTGASSGSSFPAYTSLIGAGVDAVTTMACWVNDINIENNEFDVGSGLQLPSAMNFSQRSALETKLYHKPDNSCLGNLISFLPVHNLTQNTYYLTIQSAINAANANDVIECEQYTYSERVTITKSLTLQGTDKVNCIIDGSGFATPGKGIQINSGITDVTIKRFTVQYFKGTGGNADAGIYAIGGNNNLYIESVRIQNDSGGSGFYANGPVNTVTLDSVTASGHPNVAGATRGIVIWNGLKQNITITNCEVYQNNCCGIELQDGQASGVTVMNNNIHDNGDNGIGLVGLQGPGENLIKGNTLLNNGRFGIEIKNPNGSGLTTGAGRIVVENNDVSRTAAIGGELRDICGIAAFRRGVLAGNVEIPTGVVIQNNIVSGYVQPSASDGFGIVVEGMNHTVSTNTVSGCDVGIQRQAGHTPVPPSDGDQSNLADTYFGRGNSAQTCGITLSGNILTNTVNTRDVGTSGGGMVTNINTSESFCSIQSAIDDAQTLSGHVINVGAGNYTESVIINKQLTIKGNGGSPNAKPEVTGVSGQTFSVTVPNVTIDNILVKFNQTTVTSGILASVSGSFNNLTVKNCTLNGTGTSGVPVFNSFGIQAGTFGGVLYDQVSLDSNIIKHTGTSPLGRGVKTFNCYGEWKNSNIEGFYSIQSGDISGGVLNIHNNTLKGETEINSPGTGAHIFSQNTCDPSNAYGSGTDFAMLELKNITAAGASLTVSGNTFQNYVNFGMFSGRSNNVTADNNTFTPDPTAVNFRSLRIDTKQRTTAPQSAFSSGAVITNNTFNGNAALGQAGIYVELASSDNVSSIGTVILGTSGNENEFNADVKKFISLNNETTSTSGDPIWIGTYISTKGKVTANVNAAENKYDVGSGLEFPSAMSITNLFSLEDKVQHRIDDGGIGFITEKANNDYVTVNSFVTPATTTPSIQRGIDAASAGFTVNVGNGNFTEQTEINKNLTILGQGFSNTTVTSPNTLAISYITTGVNKPVVFVHDAADVTIKGITVNGAGKGNANNRFQGIAYWNAGGTVRDCEIKSVRNSPIDGVQAGVGIYAYADNGTPRNLSVIKNNINDFQKNATVFNGDDLSARIDSNTITGAGPVSFIAQNGIQLSEGANGSIRYNTISGLSYIPSSYVSCGILLYQPDSPDTTANNSLTGCQMGIYYIDAGGLIRENTINSTAVNTGTIYYWGIDADPGAEPKVPAEPIDVREKQRLNIGDNTNTISTAIYRNTLTSDGTNGTGIEMDALGTETLNATATENIVNGWDAGVVFYKQSGATLNGIANDNDLSGNTYALYDFTGVMQNGTCNWFGTTDQFVIALKISGAVDYSPYLTNGTDNDLGASGFQPVPASCNGIPLLAYYVNDNSTANDVFTTATGSNSNPGTPSAPFLTLSYAVSSANPNDTIYIDAGTYAEQVSINKSLTIYGADSAGPGAAVIKAPAVLSTVSNANASDHKPIIYISGTGNTVNISHICIDGDGRGGDKFSGIYFYEAGGSIQHSWITRVRDAVFSGMQSGNAVFANHQYDINLDHTVIVNDNLIDDYQKTGILINEINTHGIVTNNIVTGQAIQHVNGQNGIQFGYGAYGTITGNTVTNNQYNGPATDDASGILLAGAGVDQSNTPTGNTTTVGGAGSLANIMSGNEAGLLTDGGGYGYNSNAGIIYNVNTFANNYIHVSENSPNTVPNVLNNYDKRIDNPAQTNIVYGQIQRSVNDATAGDLLNVSPHTFTEQVEINKALTLSGQGTGLTNIVSPNILPLSYTTTGVNKAVIFVHDAADVTVKGITVDGAGKGNANNRFQGIGYWNAGGTVRDCEVKAVRNTPINGVQAGVGIYAFADNGTPRNIVVAGNTIYDFQKNATVFAGDDLIARIDSNTITGAGPVSFIAQNGIQLSTGASGSIRYNTISSISYIPSTVVSCGILLYQPVGPDTTSNNSLTGCQMGIYYIDADGLISENTVANTAVNTGTTYYYGIDADPGGVPKVNANPADAPEKYMKRTVRISDNSNSLTTRIYRNVLTSDGTNGTGIEMDALGTEILNATATENKVNGWDAGIVFYKDAGATLNGIVNDNDLSGNVYAIYDFTGVTQNSTCNWFGSINPVTISAMVSGSVNYVPYLIDGTDNDAPTIGFQPVPASCTGIPPSVVNIKLIQEGFYNANEELNISDTVKAYLHSNITPYNPIDSSVSVIDSVTFTGSFIFNNAVNGTYYIEVRHRNTIETWSKSGGETFISGTTMNYDFTDAAAKAFGNNMMQIDNSPVRFAIYSGDVDQTGIVDGGDISQVENDASASLSGYVPSDVTGDYYVDASDLSITENNASAGVQVVTP